MEDLRDGADQERLGQARRAGDQTVAAGEEADQELMGRLLLADDDLAQLVLDAAAALVDLLDDPPLILVGVCVSRHDGSSSTQRSRRSADSIAQGRVPIVAVRGVA